MPQHIVWLEELSSKDIATVGGKGANLGEMLRAGLPVPRGFVVTVDAFRAALEEGHIREELRKRFSDLNPDDARALAVASELSRRAILELPMPRGLQEVILKAYEQMGRGAVAVRSSATAEDTEGTSFAGMHESYTNVVGDGQLMDKVRACWASAFGERVLSYRKSQHMSQEPALAVVVQRMVNAQRSGVIFTVDPSTQDNHLMILEAAFGLGEVVVGGQVEVDTYTLHKIGPRLVSVHVGQKAFKKIRGPEGKEHVLPLSAQEGSARVLTDDEAVRLGSLALKVEHHFHVPQDIEWAEEGGEWLLVQTRPITTLKEKPPQAFAGGKTLLLSGLPASSGVASGPVRVLRSPAEGDTLQNGEVLVARMTSPDWVPVMRRASAIVTDSGGLTCHAAIVSRELHIPCVVGTRSATQNLRDGEWVTVDGAKGQVWEGKTKSFAPVSVVRPAAASTTPVVESLGTRVYVNLAMAEQAEEVAALPVDGVGLLRAEFLMTSALGGQHPNELLATGGKDEFVHNMRESILRIARAFGQRPVVYRAYDFKTNEFRGLKNGEKYEPKEENPMLGFRGAYRYTKTPELFLLELEVLAQV